MAVEREAWVVSPCGGTKSAASRATVPRTWYPTTIEDNMANTTRAQIISDLCQKYPTGPRGRIRKDHYTVKTAWVAEYGR